MSRPSAFVLSLLVALGLSSDALAATFPVDDSTSLPGVAQTKMQWRSLGPNRVAGDFVDGATVVTLRLNTARWINRVGQIYMVLPSQPIGLVNVNWTTQGKLLPGTLVSGSRALIYAGLIRAPTIEDTIEVHVHTDGKRLTSAQRLQFNFEIDVE